MQMRMLFHMTQPSFITDVETALESGGFSVAAMCRRAEIAQSSWHRWKLQGVTPRNTSRARVLQAMASLGVPLPIADEVSA